MPKLPRRKRDVHKGQVGRVLVIGGSRGMIGAPALVAEAALRSGAGLVTIACPKSIQTTVAGLCPCATSIPLTEGVDGLINPHAALRELRGLGLLDRATGPTVVAAGPGLGRSNTTHAAAVLSLLRAFRDEAEIPTVLDADALNAIAQERARDAETGLQESAIRPAVITPHPAELAGMLGTTTAEVQADRRGAAVQIADALSPTATDGTEGPVVVLKGAGTIVTDGSRYYVNETGNAGMATGGAGDVLTGVIAALIGQGMTAFDAAVFGANIHGSAGDLAAKELGKVSIIATDLIDYLPYAFKRAAARR